MWFEHCDGYSGGNYEDEADCLDQCAAIPEGNEDDMVGDTVYCRVNHAEMGDDDNNDHCGHAYVEPTGICQ